MDKEREERREYYKSIMGKLDDISSDNKLFREGLRKERVPQVDNGETG